jgi:hypothetical protein
MKDAFDTLERELRRAVRARRARRARRALVLAVAAVLALAGVAASRIADAPDREREVAGQPEKTAVDRVFIKVIQATRMRPECRPARKTAAPQLDVLPLAPSIGSVLPALGKPPRSGNAQRAADLMRNSGTGGTILRQSARTLEFAAGRVTVWVLDGGFVPEEDPEACATARRARAAELASGELLAAVERRLASAGRQVGGQTLYLSADAPGVSGAFISGFPSEPKLRTGIVDRHDLSENTRRYIGIASRPGVAWVQVEQARRMIQEIRVRDGFYVFTLERGSGRARLTETTLGGKPVRTIRVPR